MSNPVVRVRHIRLRGEKVISPLGDILLDEKGYVTNLDQLAGGVEALMKLPNYVDGDTFPAPEDVGKSPIETTSKTTDELVNQVKNGNPADDDDYKPPVQPNPGASLDPVSHSNEPPPAPVDVTKFNEGKPASDASAGKGNPTVHTGEQINKESVPRGEYWELIKACEAIKKNGAGYADTTLAIQKMREKSYPLLTGTQIREITDEFRAKSPEQTQN